MMLRSPSPPFAVISGRAKRGPVSIIPVVVMDSGLALSARPGMTVNRHFRRGATLSISRRTTA
jgi:hypothetical protein